MTTNDIIRNLRFIFNFNDERMIKLFALAGRTTTRAEISDWLKKDDDPAFVSLEDQDLALFLNGFIIYKRGKKDGPPMRPETRLNNNIIMRKLKIALSMRDEDIVAVLKLVDIRVSKHEINAFFRKPDQRQFRKCLDQFLRNFIFGLKVKYRKDINLEDKIAEED